MTAPQATADLANRLHSAAIHLLRRLRSRDAATGLSGPAASALSVIVYAGPLTLGRLAEAEQVRPPTITRLIQGLERRGLVRRAADPGDRRKQRVEATARGRRLLEEGRRRRIAALAEALEELPAAERARLADAVATLEQIAGPASPWLTRPDAARPTSRRARPARRSSP